MKTNYKSSIRPKHHPFNAVYSVPVLLVLGVLASFAQSDIYQFTGSETTVTLNPGLYNITAYGAQGGNCEGGPGDLGAEMEAEFDFTTATALTVLVGGAGANDFTYSGAGGGGGSFVVSGNTPLVIAGGGGAGSGYTGSFGLTGSSGSYGINNFNGGTGGAGGSGGSGGAGGGNSVEAPLGGGGGGGYSGTGGIGYTSTYSDGGGYSGGGGGGGDPLHGGGGGGGGSIIGSSATMVLAEFSGVASPNGSPNGEIIVTAVPEPTILALVGLSGLSLLLLRRQSK